jgi:hypothetical protein
MSPSRWWHLFSVAILLLAGIIIPLGAPVFAILFLSSSGEEFFVPGRHDLKLSGAGVYTVWNVTSAFRSGRQYNFPQSLPDGASLRVVDQATGKELATVPALGCRESMGSTEKNAVCDFTVGVNEK